ncbi:AbrB/MazE/SpoVT family DNA-binding domain-containing protein [Paenibacillus sp. 481]|uniref:AbrB/MazE/SpoVT family DNA-binding domain-containing protein n=1 Tax=Paenibacillus sp. 481 TaxID=2835869 RepID=UPI001E5B80E2|nr:AbrB/MazE/SpoVT family DNA-binding domain-containing protein [Paenibacillus sp. 481]
MAKLSCKGQITVPKHIRDVLQIHEGDRVAFIEENGLVIMAKADLQALHDLQDILCKEKIENIIHGAKKLLER